MKKRIFIPVLCLLFYGVAGSQPLWFSTATDVSLQRNFKKDQRYWAIGQTVTALFNLTPREGFYTWFVYYSNGNFKNNVTATAKSGSTSPQEIRYVNRSRMRLKHFSVGWRKYLRGSADGEKGWNLYAYAGFGLLLGRVINSFSQPIDTALYNLPVLPGKANFKRLTIDPGIGWEKNIGGDLFLYAEVRAWVPTTDYPSSYIFVNNNAPWTGMLNLGFRVMF